MSAKKASLCERRPPERGLPARSGRGRLRWPRSVRVILRRSLSGCANWIDGGCFSPPPNTSLDFRGERHPPWMRVSCGLVLFLFMVSAKGADEPKVSPPLYENNLEQIKEDKMPDDFLVLNGEFKVKKEGENKVLELPETPLPDLPPGFGLLFGPAKSEDVRAGARFQAASKGKRGPPPTFALGLGGVGGFFLQVNPKDGELQLLRGEAEKTVEAWAAFTWKSGAWTQLRLQIRKVKEALWCVEGKAWTEGEDEPKAWALSWESKEQPPTGRASLWGCPFSGLPILFDDLVVTKAEKGSDGSKESK